jgi:hypothetical protein
MKAIKQNFSCYPWQGPAEAEDAHRFLISGGPFIRLGFALTLTSVQLRHYSGRARAEHVVAILFEVLRFCSDTVHRCRGFSVRSCGKRLKSRSADSSFLTP